MGRETVNKFLHDVLLVLGVLSQSDLHGLGTKDEVDLQPYKLGRRAGRKPGTKNVHMIAEIALEVGLGDIGKTTFLRRLFHSVRSGREVVVLDLVDRV